MTQTSLSPALCLAPRQKQTMTPRLQQAVRLLQLSSLEFAQQLQQALGHNPFLEEDLDADAGAPAPGPEAPAWQGEDLTPTARASQAASAVRPDGDLSVVDSLPGQTTLREHLHAQANLMPLSERDHALLALLIESVDDDGWLRTPLGELRAFAPLAPPAGADEMRIALNLLQSLDPPGTGARDLRECLSLQSELIVDAGLRALVRRIVDGHLARLAQRDVTRLAQDLGAEPEAVAAACERIRRLDPHPGWRFDGARTHYVTPDVIVRRGADGRWITQLNPEVVPRLRLNDLYADLFQRHRRRGQGALAADLREARWTLRNVEQRFRTILDVASAIVERQHAFFEHGPLAMRPLGLREIARDVGIHESTVCRVTNNKFMATPAGVFELKYFFSRALATHGGGRASATAIRGVIRELIEAESPATPLSDVQLARLLQRQGYAVARRTVTKYRQAMRLPAVERRRRPSA